MQWGDSENMRVGARFDQSGNEQRLNPRTHVLGMMKKMRYITLIVFTCIKAKLSFAGVVNARCQRRGEVALRSTRRVQSHDRQGGRLVS